jgi:hypothetical protein
MRGQDTASHRTLKTISRPAGWGTEVMALVVAAMPDTHPTAEKYGELAEQMERRAQKTKDPREKSGYITRASLSADCKRPVFLPLRAISISQQSRGPNASVSVPPHSSRRAKKTPARRKMAGVSLSKFTRLSNGPAHPS